MGPLTDSLYEHKTASNPRVSVVDGVVRFAIVIRECELWSLFRCDPPFSILTDVGCSLKLSRLGCAHVPRLR